MEGISARPGQPVSAQKWNRMEDKTRGNRVVAGDNVSIHRAPDWTMIRVPRRNANFSHPFACVLVSTDSALVYPGLVNGLEPTIDGVKLSGEAGKTAPLLGISDKNDISYIALEITCNEKWQIVSATIVQVADFCSDATASQGIGTASENLLAAGFPSLTNKRTRYPLAKLIKQSNGGVYLFQIAYFNLQHRAYSRDQKGLVVRHFFWPG